MLFQSRWLRNVLLHHIFRHYLDLHHILQCRVLLLLLPWRNIQFFASPLCHWPFRSKVPSSPFNLFFPLCSLFRTAVGSNFRIFLTSIFQTMQSLLYNSFHTAYSQHQSNLRLVSFKCGIKFLLVFWISKQKYSAIIIFEPSNVF